jgi:hypothetical protein
MRNDDAKAMRLPGFEPGGYNKTGARVRALLMNLGALRLPAGGAAALDTQVKRAPLRRSARGWLLALSLPLVATAALAQATNANWRTTNNPVTHSAAAQFQSAASANEPVSITVTLKLNNEQALNQLLVAQRTPGNPNYRRWLSSNESTQQFAPTAAQAQAVANYLQRNGFTNIRIAPNRLLVSADGTATLAQIAFNTQIGIFRGSKGRRALGNLAEVQVPAELSQVSQVLGLDTLAMPVTHSRPTLVPVPVAVRTASNSMQTASLGDGGANGYYSDGFSTVYNRPSNQDGRNTVAAIIGWGNMTPSVNDLRQFETTRSIATVPTSIVYYPGGSVTATPDVNDQVEWSMDAQAIVGISGGVKQLIFYSTGNTETNQNTMLQTINRVVSDNTARVINMSWSWVDPPGCGGSSSFVKDYDAVFKLGTIQGQTFAAASGDHGSYPCKKDQDKEDKKVENGTYGDESIPAVEYPSGSPYVVAVGGTTLSTGAGLAYNSETAWAYSGGGISTIQNSKPDWQSSLTGSYRQTPDLAFNADWDKSPILMYMNHPGYPGQYLFANGGTSLSAPLFAGAWAVMESANDNSLGFAPPVIYPYTSQLYSSFTLHDVAMGNNGYYPAKTGYDNATGWGSFDITKMLAFLANGVRIYGSANTGGSISPASVMIQPGAPYTFTITPNAGYYIASISGCDGPVITGGSTISINPTRNYTTGIINSSCTVNVTFGSVSATYTITATAGTGGTISPSGTIMGVTAGQPRVFTVTPNPGYYIASMSGCGGTAVTGDRTYTTARSYTTGAINSNCTVSATFKEINIWDPYEGTIPYTYTDNYGNAATAAAFRVESKTWNRGWFPGFGVINQSTALGAVRFTQLLNSPKICVQIYKYSPGWSTPQEVCTAGIGTQITLGEESTYSIQSMNVRLKDCAYNDNLTGDAYLGAIVTISSCNFFTCNSYSYEQAEWQSPITAESCSQKIRLGIHIGNPSPPYMSAFDLKIKRNDSGSSSSNSSLPIPTVNTSGMPGLRPVVQ